MRSPRPLRHDRHRRYQPLNYLVLIQQTDLLPRLFGQILIPPAVWEELNDPDTPALVHTWLAQSPSWLQVRSLQSQPDPTLDSLDDGEREAIALAEDLQADEILIDELSARKEAARRHLRFIGTLGILRRAAQLDLIDLPPRSLDCSKPRFTSAPT
jgi:predicted nucleic acid-binding protein